MTLHEYQRVLPLIWTTAKDTLIKFYDDMNKPEKDY